MAEITKLGEGETAKLRLLDGPVDEVQCGAVIAEPPPIATGASFELQYQHWMEQHGDLGDIDPELLKLVAQGWWLRGVAYLHAQVEATTKRVLAE